MRCIVIEDENPAQEVLKEYLAQCPSLSLHAVYNNALDAQAALNSGQVDLLFLDINLPLISGIDLLKSLKNSPQVIITTAYPEYALEGFDLDVTDYLLKPFSFARFLKATNKALKQFNGGEERNRQIQQPEQKFEPLIFNIDKVLYKVDPDTVLYVASDRDYITFYTEARKYVMVGALSRWEKLLPQSKFLRIHRSYIVNLNAVKQVNGNQVTIGKQVLPLGRKYKPFFIEKFGRPT
ncbi:LytTR family two component transcriptional regulator [Roseivirga pacifica]|uniref:Two component transcriptional regulator, LytTR family n=1 Tax=Roseivirga pacifica TaxID=1267423 RepID=A0A1I0Q3A0_9BACT|nr:LytTR family DNA-binding domain-containing protein [Roseivirga pacifica]RKQ43287.1 LytTR family two component transcriptional regulator [Roseivirga pacifica]SEW21352.1 two component transcriptional regulator, LytTR family [Roseivirga pacifica]|tara:strand:+ start:524 stop:1234 length:711 start_codon:yes stop_codon:yes gene_type:complete